MLLWGAAHSVTRIYVKNISDAYDKCAHKHPRQQKKEKNCTPLSHSLPLATSTKKREKKEEGYNRLDIIWSTKDNQNKHLFWRCHVSAKPPSTSVDWLKGTNMARGG
jgi:hypothetical protein